MNLQIKLVIFTVQEGRLFVYRDKENGLPTKKIEKENALDTTAQNTLQTIGLPTNETYVEQLYTFGKTNEIVVGYYILVPSHLLQLDDRWRDSGKLEIVSSFDREIIQYAIQRLRWKIEYTNVVYSLLPVAFTLSELQEVYEVILGKELDKRNFRKKIRSLHLVKSTGKVRKGLATRPAQVYTFRKRTPARVKIFA